MFCIMRCLNGTVDRLYIGLQENCIKMRRTLVATAAPGERYWLALYA